jgi:hypothetical protein
MSLLFRIVYAAHANGTHHKLALDGLAELDIEGREDWQRLFLKHADLFMEGAKAPDTKFKDFKNHVLHVRDNYWGGAPDLVAEWYARTIEDLRANSWTDAVYSAGVLSHYVTDPLMPFHTGQTDAENAIHAAAEWSINRSYNDLRKLGLSRGQAAHPARPAGENWLRAIGIAGAERANAQYERLIAHYDIKRGVVDPPSGLDEVARNLVADLLIEAASLYAVILGAAIAEAGARPPQVDLTLATVLAAIKIPAKTLAKRLADASDRAIVEAQYDQLMATGKVEKTLRPEDLVVRDLFAAEVLAPRRQAQEIARSLVLIGGSAVARAGPLDHPVAAVSSPREPTVRPSAPEPSAGNAPKVHLKLSDPVEAAPIIGPKLASRLVAAGIATVGDLMSADPAALRQTLSDRRLDEAAIRHWQLVARLVMDVPGLRGTQAQLLAGAGFRSVGELATADPSLVARRVVGFAQSQDGMRVLRDGKPPDEASVIAWTRWARTTVEKRDAA